MKYSIKKYTRRRCYNKNKKKQNSNKGRSIKKHYGRRRITLHKKSKMRKQRKTKKMYQYGGGWDEFGNWNDGDPPQAEAAAAEEPMGAAAAAEGQDVPGDQVPSANGETPGDDGDYYIDVPLSPTGFPEDYPDALDHDRDAADLAVSKQELLKIFRDFPDVLDSLTTQDPDTVAGILVGKIVKKACEECPAITALAGASGSACVFDRPNQNQLYGKLLEMIFAILKVLLRGDALSDFFSLGPCVPFDIPPELTSDTYIPKLFRNCAISVKTLLDTEKKLSRRETPSTGRIACGDAAIFLDSLRQCVASGVALKMVVIDYFLKKDEVTGRTSSVVPRIMAVYNLTANQQLIFGSNTPEEALDRVSNLKGRIALAQDPKHTSGQRKTVLSEIRRDVKEFNVWMANGGGGLCCAYKQSKKADTVIDGPKQQIRLQISVVLWSVTMQPKDFNEWQRLGYRGTQTIAGIQPEQPVELDPFPPQQVGTPTKAGEKVTMRSWRGQYTNASGQPPDTSGHPPGASARLPKKPKGAIARSNLSGSKSKKTKAKLLQ